MERRTPKPHGDSDGYTKRGALLLDREPKILDASFAGFPSDEELLKGRL